jgi:hypothetical protein
MESARNVGGSNLEAADAIRAYLRKAEGDARLALALCVADQIAMTRLVAAAPGGSAAERQGGLH